MSRILLIIGGGIAAYKSLDLIRELNSSKLKRDVHHPEVEGAIETFELAFRMQNSVPALLDLKAEQPSTFKSYGIGSGLPTDRFGRQCLLARRMAERDVRFVQLFHRGWDHHSGLPGRHRKIAKEVDQGSAALIQDLRQRGMLDDTLVIWGGEFGRTVYRQGGNETNYGRDHHPYNFTYWMAGGGIKGGTTYGETDDFSYNVTENGVHLNDLKICKKK